MSTHNIGFYKDLTKIIFPLSSNMHRISSSATVKDRKLLPNYISKTFSQTTIYSLFISLL